MPILEKPVISSEVKTVTSTRQAAHSPEPETRRAVPDLPAPEPRETQFCSLLTSSTTASHSKVPKTASGGASTWADHRPVQIENQRCWLRILVQHIAKSKYLCFQDFQLLCRLASRGDLPSRLPFLRSFRCEANRRIPADILNNDELNLCIAASLPRTHDFEATADSHNRTSQGFKLSVHTAKS